MGPRGVLLLLLLPALAGCTAQPRPLSQDPAAEPLPAAIPTPVADGNATAPEQGEFARSLDERFHTHNYWDEAREKVLLDADVSSADLRPQASPRGVFAVRGTGRSVPFTLPEGSIVPPETDRLVVTITWAESPTITGLALAYVNASSKETHVLDPLPPGGGTYELACDLLSNDIPHTAVSKWRFALLPRSEQGPAMFNGTVHVTVTAHRPDTLYVAPPHPDFWGAATTLDLFTYHAEAQETAAGFYLAEVLGFVDSLQGGPDPVTGFGDIPLPNGTLVPPHTGALTVVLRWQNNATAPDPGDFHPQLTYEAADTGAERAPPTAVRDGDLITYIIPLDPRMWDSPYQTESQWLLVVEPHSGGGDLPAAALDVGAFDGWYSLEVRAERETLA